MVNAKRLNGIFNMIDSNVTAQNEFLVYAMYYTTL